MTQVEQSIQSAVRALSPKAKFKKERKAVFDVAGW